MGQSNSSFNDECQAFEQSWLDISGGGISGAGEPGPNASATGKANAEKGEKFAKRVYNKLKKRYPRATIEREVTCGNGRADIYIKHPNRWTAVVECKNYSGNNKLSKSDVDQVVGYRECLKAHHAILCISHTTQMTGDVQAYADSKKVKIIRLKDIPNL